MPSYYNDKRKKPVSGKTAHRGISSILTLSLVTSGFLLASPAQAVQGPEEVAPSNSNSTIAEQDLARVGDMEQLVTARSGGPVPLAGIEDVDWYKTRFYFPAESAQPSLPDGMAKQTLLVVVGNSTGQSIPGLATSLKATTIDDLGTGVISRFDWVGSGMDAFYRATITSTLPGDKRMKVTLGGVELDSIDGRIVAKFSGKPVFTTESLPSGKAGVAYSAPVVANGYPNPTYTATGMPAGLSINSSTGVISGTPTASGSFQIAVTATNSSGSATKSYSVTFAAADVAPVVTTQTLPAGKAGVAYSATVAATGSPAPTFSATGMPAGLSINSSTGVISGTPTASGNFQIAVTATNAAGTNTKTFSVAFAVADAKPSIATQSLPSGKAGVAYSATVAATGSPAPTFTATGMPAGLSINSSTGVISGTPTASGNFQIAVTATNSSGSATKSYSVTFAAADVVPVVTTQTLPAGKAGVAYSATVAATGNPNPTFSATGMPAGLSINSSTGVISGTPTASGNFQIAVTATNAAGTNTKTFSVAFAVADAKPSIATQSLPSGTTGVAYSTKVVATGSPAPTFTATGLPDGLTINTSTGVISGTPTTVGSSQVAVTATNASGTDTKTYTISVALPVVKPEITTKSLPSGKAGVEYSATVAVTGTPVPTLSVSGLPAGLTMDNTTGVISGTPRVSGSFSVKIVASNSGATVSKTFTVAIAAADAVPNVTTKSLPAARVGVSYSATVAATGNPAPAFSATGLPAGLGINSKTGKITGTPSVTGTFAVQITAKNSVGTDSKTFSIAIAAKQKVGACDVPRGKSVFVDVPKSQKFYNEIDWFNCVKYTTGIRTSAGLAYEPQMRLSREAMAAFIFRMEASKDYVAPKTSPFADVQTTDKFYKEIAWMWEQKLTTGFKQPAGKPRFEGKQGLTREAMAAFIYRLEKPQGYKAPAKSPLEDLTQGQAFYKEISWMFDERLTTGIKTDTGKAFSPKAQLSREAMAAFIYRLVKEYRTR